MNDTNKRPRYAQLVDEIEGSRTPVVVDRPLVEEKALPELGAVAERLRDMLASKPAGQWPVPITLRVDKETHEAFDRVCVLLKLPKQDAGTAALALFVEAMRADARKALVNLERSFLEADIERGF